MADEQYKFYFNKQTFLSEKFPPIEFTKILFKKVDISMVESIIKNTSIDHVDVEIFLNKMNPDVIVEYNKLIKEHMLDNEKINYCNALNYYLNFMTEIVNALKISKDIISSIINFNVEGAWIKYYCDTCYCKRRKNVYSTHVNCLITKLRDNIYVNHDLENIKVKEQEGYWSKIFQESHNCKIQELLLQILLLINRGTLLKKSPQLCMQNHQVGVFQMNINA
ncbi:variable surface protein [Plasmodium gonderi]|uniref:Variable surface protein n=1 Tax=Plasmodium gonderi TaxID=77519 RepID=A0A1Y1JWM4_PLAGO|nr:variable surface protein [Plasmodium gonderi]GAW84723.1 variable surface protein [Plasmodium gonderi]